MYFAMYFTVSGLIIAHENGSSNIGKEMTTI